AYFGFGLETNIDIVRIEWPSGIVQELHAVTAKQLLAVTEPVVSIAPASLALNRGQAATFTANTTLLPPLSFQWFRNGIAIPGSTAASLAITNMQTSDAGNYSVQVQQADPLMFAFAKPASLIGPIVLQANQQLISSRP